MTTTSRIAKIEAFPVPPRWMFVRVTDESGAVGWGESIVPKRRDAVLGAITDFARLLEGQDAGRIEDIFQQMRKGAFFRHGPVLCTAAAGIEIALWDLKARSVGLPIYEFLGGQVRDSVRSYCWIGGDSPADVVAHARARIEAGFSAVKMNATSSVPALGYHAEIDALVERMGSLRDAFGRSLDIALDFHGRVPRTALKELVRAVEPFHPMWLEEPFLPEADDTQSMLAGLSPNIPIATGERLLDRWQFKRLLDRGGVDIIQPDVSITGLFELEKIARMAEAYDVFVAPHCPNGPVSLAASLQVGFCCTNVVIQEQSLGLHYNQGYKGLPAADLLDYLADAAPLTTHAGAFGLLQGPGLGIDLKDAGIEGAQDASRMADAGWRHQDGSFAEW